MTLVRHDGNKDTVSIQRSAVSQRLTLREQPSAFCGQPSAYFLQKLFP
ncbi:hypothetical protein [Moorena sp. SIO3I6]|nr:hypothetical protein [Moorena sp. SIO3I6]NEP24829.1 hypothetical protein [Moorena sp. SIO3I6]